MKRTVASVLAVFLSLPGVLSAGIYKLGVPSTQGIQLMWWPILPVVPGWQHDEGASRTYSVNMLIPNGQTFSAAPAVIYAKAMYKPPVPQTNSLAQLIASDRAEFSAKVPGVRIKELPPLHDGDGKALRCFSFSPASRGSWDLAAYGEEDDYYLIFTVSAKTSKALQETRATFAKMVSRYKKSL